MLTVPEIGPGVVDVMLAVNVTLWPRVEGFEEDTTLVIVEAGEARFTF